MLIYDVLHKETIYQTIVSDLRNLGVKYRFKKNVFKTERPEGVKNISRKVFKTPLSYQPLDVVNLSSGGIVHVPVFVSQATSFLEKHVAQEGLFRKAGSQLRQRELVARLDSGGTFGEKHNAIDVANCLKTFFRDLPEPLIPYMYHDLFVHCATLKTSCVQALLLACILLPPHHLNTLAFFMEFLKKVSLYEKQNKMSIDNLAKVVGPNIMPLQEATMSAVQTRLELHLVIIKILIENAESIGVLPDHIAQVISAETIGSTDNDLDTSDCQSRSKSRKKKHRSGSLTRKPHLSASNLNLRMFNGLRKIVGKGTLSDDNMTDNHHSENYDSSNPTIETKSTKKRKVGERTEALSLKKKRVVDKPDKSKKIRLSLDRFVPKSKQKLMDEDSESCENTFNLCTERRWSSVSNSCDSQRKRRIRSNGLSKLHLILKDNEVPNSELQKEYNDVFIDADVNLSDDSDEQVLLAKNDRISINRCRKKLSLSSNESKTADELDQIHSCPPKQRLTLNGFDIYSTHIKTSDNNQCEEYVRIPKSEYEEIKNRVSAIESRISQEFGCADNSENDSLSVHSVNKVQTAYEKTLEEASIESTATADYLARKLGKELKIRRSGEHKIIRSPSARKIGTLRRRSQEKIMSSKHIRRTASWHISRGLDLKPENRSNQEIDQSYSINSQLSYPSQYVKEDTYLPRRSTSVWEEQKRNVKLSDLYKQTSSSDLSKCITSKHNVNSNDCDLLQSEKSRARASVRRVSSFHGNEFANSNVYLNNKIEKLRKTNSQQSIITNNRCMTKQGSKLDGWKETALSWKDADGYFKSTAQVNSPVVQTGRASIAKLRAQNAGMVLAKAKLFDECTTKACVQGNLSNKKYECVSVSEEPPIYTSKHKEVGRQNIEPASRSCKRAEAFYRKTNKSIKIKNSKQARDTCLLAHSKMATENVPLEAGQGENKDNVYEHTLEESTEQDSQTIRTQREKTNNILHKTTYKQKENVSVKTPPFVRKLSVNTISHDTRVNIYKSDSSALCKTPHIKKPLTVKTPKSGRTLVRKSIIDSRRTPLKAVGQIGTPKYQSPKGILKTRNLSRHT